MDVGSATILSQAAVKDRDQAFQQVFVCKLFVLEIYTYVCRRFSEVDANDFLARHEKHLSKQRRSCLKKVLNRFS